MPIEDYSLIGDCETAALVSRDGSIDWLCLPTFSSGACFAALLGTRDHGFWKIAPDAKPELVSRAYIADTLVVETKFVTRGGEVAVTDFMPPRKKNSNIIRIVRGVRGRVKMRMEIAIRFDYGRTVPWVTRGHYLLRAVAGGDMIVLRTRAPLRAEGLTTVSEFTLRAGQTMSFTLSSLSSLAKVPAALHAAKALKQTKRFWEKWAHRSTYRGRYADAVNRSMITLKALTYRPSGGIVAAPTTSLPEKIGGTRNWDYRLCWLRDTSFTLLALMQGGYQDEGDCVASVAAALVDRQARSDSKSRRSTESGVNDRFQSGRRTGCRAIGTRVRCASEMPQRAVSTRRLSARSRLALIRTPQAADDIRVSASALLATLIDHLCSVWRQPDEGIWETRGGRKHFTHSKVMAWVALDRAIRYHERFDGGGDLPLWKKNRELIHREVCAKGFNKRLNSFVQSYGSTELDASLLRLVLVGFLPADDPRILGTVAAIEKHLMRGGLVERYNTRTTRDGLPSGEGVFLACSFWMVSNLWLIGRKADATALYERLLKLRNDVGLLSEEYDPTHKRMIGNFPQALSHIALVHAAFTLSGTWKPDRGDGQRT